MKKNNGFSLLELLIVIGLIGILIAISVTSYSTIQKKTRDSRRISDLKAVQNGFEQYYADNTGVYPVATTVLTAYLPFGIPKDPKGTSYPVVYGANGVTYCMCASMESIAGNFGAGDCATAGSTYYCVKNLQ